MCHVLDSIGGGGLFTLGTHMSNIYVGYFLNSTGDLTRMKEEFFDTQPEYCGDVYDNHHWYTTNNYGEYVCDRCGWKYRNGILYPPDSPATEESDLARKRFRRRELELVFAHLDCMQDDMSSNDYVHWVSARMIVERLIEQEEK